MRIFPDALWAWAGASSDSGVVEDGNFWRLGWLLLWKR